jgi:hypothetical protein
LDHVGKAVSMVVVHVCKEDRVELLRYQGSGTGKTIERLWAALRAGQGHDKAWRCMGGCTCCKPDGGKQRNCGKRRPHGRPLLGSKSAVCPGLQPVEIWIRWQESKRASWHFATLLCDAPIGSLLEDSGRASSVANVWMRRDWPEADVEDCAGFAEHAMATAYVLVATA